MIVGPVGSGKTTLLYSLMEETVMSAGNMTIKGKIAYVEQEPFIISGTVKDNILFGLPFDHVKFDKCVKACQLTRDLEIMDKGMMTVIGDRGINISGG